jgi:hypothetical protein
MSFLKKRLTNGVEGGASAGNEGDISSEPSSTLPALASSLPSVTSSSPPVFCVGDARLRSLDSRDIPATSLAQALDFAKRFLDWCASAGISGAMDWPKLFQHSQEFALEEEVQHFSAMALSKALTELARQNYRGFRKTGRFLKSHEKPDPRLKRASGAKRPRVVVYVLPAGQVPPVNDDPQLDFFE